MATLGSQRLSSARRALGAATLAITLIACSSEPDDTRAAAACSLPPRIESPDGLPSDFPELEGMTFTSAEVKAKFVSVAGYMETTVEELFDVASDAVEASRFDIINTDFEGFEAEIYFARGSAIAGIVMMREGPCDGFVKTNVLYDPLETEAGRKAVKKTKDLFEGSRATATPGP